MQQNNCLKMRETEYTLDIPGRLRIKNDLLKNNQLLCNKFAGDLSMISGVLMASANPYTGKTLLIYDPERAAPDRLKESIARTIKNYTPDSASKPKIIQADFRHKVLLNHKDFADSRNVLSDECYKYNVRQLFPDVCTAAGERPWHTLTEKETERVLRTSRDKGLSPEKVRERLKKCGLNEFTQKKKKSMLSILLHQFEGFISKLLFAAVGASLLLGQYVDAFTIAAIIAVESALGVWQEYKAEQSLDSLKKLAVPVASVIRDGKKQEIAAGFVVPGDVILLEAGCSVPADARIIESSNLETMEAPLTGESQPIFKQSGRMDGADAAIGDRTNMVYMGTSVVRGRGKAIVVATGMRTEMGRIAGMLNDSRQEKTPLQRDLNKMAKIITWGCIGICSVITFGGILRGYPMAAMLSTGVSLAVGAIPEGLMTVLAISLAFAAQRMAKKNAIVKTLPTIETLSCMRVICTDKTGTLTRNEMTVKELSLAGKNIKLTGEGYNTDGELLFEAGRIRTEDHYDLRMLLTSCALCNNAEVTGREDRQYDIKGDPTEAALWMAVKKSGMAMKEFDCFKREHEIPFDAQTKKMTAICSDSEGKYYMFTKGAIDTILPLCTRIQSGDTVESMAEGSFDQIQEINEKMAGRALRVLAFAYKPLDGRPADFGDAELEKDMIFQGLAGIMDPPRAEVKEAIKKCHHAGIKVVMITGDHKNTAMAVADSIGLLTEDGVVLSGEELDKMSEEELSGIIDHVQVFARTCPEQKLKIVKAFKKKGHIVAMTGDGVNDAPALKEANIGIAMGKGGTDVTKEASSIILTDDNFWTVVKAVEEGRTVNRNIKKFVRYVLAGNLAEVIAIFAASVLGMPLPLTAAQILIFNLATEGMPALSLGVDPPENDIMNEQPRNPAESIFDSKIKRSIIIRGIVTGITTLGIFAASLYTGGSLAKARTLAFANLVASQLLHTFECSSTGAVRNKYLIPSVAVSTGIMLACLYAAPLCSMLGMVPLGFADWGLLIILILISRAIAISKGLLNAVGAIHQPVTPLA